MRCAEMTRLSKGTPSAVELSAASRMVSQSDDEPMMMPTSGFIAEVLAEGARPSGTGRS